MYLNQEAQKEMIQIMREYQELSQFGKISNRKTELLINKFLTEYVDKIIKGVLGMEYPHFLDFGEEDDLIQEGRIAVLLSVHKDQWIESKGTIFTFFTSVIIRNLMNFTNKTNKYKEIATDLLEMSENTLASYEQNYHKDFLMDDVFQSIRSFFSGKDKYLELTNLLEHYYLTTVGKKFVKKNFIEFSKLHNFSPAVTNTFFSYIKRIKYHDTSIELLFFEGDEQ